MVVIVNILRAEPTGYCLLATVYFPFACLARPVLRECEVIHSGARGALIVLMFSGEKLQ